MKTTASNLKVRQLIRMVQSGALVPRPEFQRRLVWTTEDKNRFVDTVLMGYPFPEIYLANGEIDTETGEGKQLLVDGQQRVSTLVQYFQGDSTLALRGTKPYAGLVEDEKRRFLDYDVAVRDLGEVSSQQIIEVFRRINATSYALKDIEINNAVYAGEFKRFAERVAAMPFFDDHRVFRADDIRRMGDLRYALLIAVTYLQGYFNRDDQIEPALAAYNESFPRSEEMWKRVVGATELVEELGFEGRSRAWKKGDLFTLLVEVDLALTEGWKPAHADVAKRLEDFYEEVDMRGMESPSKAAYVYYKASVQASNDRINRIRRGIIVGALLRGEVNSSVVAELP